MGLQRTIFSFVVDDDPRFAYEAWHLARSLVEHCGGEPGAIHVQCTPGAYERRASLFREQGYAVHELARFGDGRHCNKIAQLDNLRDAEFDRAVLLDTDMLALADLRPFLRDDAIQGKIVDMANPPLAALREIAAASGLTSLPPVCATDARDGETYAGNCNGGFYCVPRALCEPLSAHWRRWALWLLENAEPLRRVQREQHADQVSFWLALQHAALPFEAAPSNLNYYVHFAGAHAYFDEARAIALLHYHAISMNVVGMLDPPAALTERERTAVAAANRQIAGGFDNRVFWDMRYRHFPQRGSGIGSRGDNLAYKRRLLQAQGIETAASVLDVGCGDLEVVKELDLRRYLGIDQSPQSLGAARRARPEWEFRTGLGGDVPAAEMVLCFEVLIHQETAGAYHGLIAFLAAKTLRALLVSGYAADSDGIRSNPMLFFHEPLETSLRRTGRFSSIRQIGAHTDVVVYRCEV
ncbi:MAG: hypothetical protein JWM87_320 [Candidatus Eremiobacteraeota bacterium]|nr:hypothetical protein [Candidatus Eremiobacteraeota bacterium]